MRHENRILLFKTADVEVLTVSCSFEALKLRDEYSNRRFVQAGVQGRSTERRGRVAHC